MATTDSASSEFSSTLALCLAIIGAASMLYYHEGLFIPRAASTLSARGLGNGYSFGNDFYQLWITSREWLTRGRDPYSQQMTREIQIGLYGRPLDPNRPTDPIDQRAFPYPIYADLLFAPTAEFPFPLMRVVVISILAALTFASALMWLRAMRWQLSWKSAAVITLFVMSSYPALEGLFAVQIGLLVAFLMAASILALQKARYFLAGTLMALTTVKPQVTAMMIVFLLLWSFHDWRIRRGLAIGFFSMMTVLLGVSLALFPHWIASWIHTLFAYRGYNPPPLITSVLASPFGTHVAGPASIALIAGAALWCAMLAWRGRLASPSSFTFWITLTILLTLTTITLLPGQAVYDHIILVPVVFLLVRYREQLRALGRVPRALLMIAAVVLFWPWIAAFVLVSCQPWLLSPPHASAVLALPIRTAASLPFVVLALLIYAKRIKTAPEAA